MKRCLIGCMSGVLMGCQAGPRASAPPTAGEEPRPSLTEGGGLLLGRDPSADRLVLLRLPSGGIRPSPHYFDSWESLEAEAFAAGVLDRIGLYGGTADPYPELITPIPARELETRRTSSRWVPGPAGD